MCIFAQIRILCSRSCATVKRVLNNTYHCRAEAAAVSNIVEAATGLSAAVLQCLLLEACAMHVQQHHARLNSLWASNPWFTVVHCRLAGAGPAAVAVHGNLMALGLPLLVADQLSESPWHGHSECAS